MRTAIRRLLCIFPFEEDFFRRAGIDATYIGHPLAGLVAPSVSREAFFEKHSLDPARPSIAVLPGSRRGEAARHLPALLDAVDRISRAQAVNVVLPASVTTGADFFRERTGRSTIRVIEGESWDAMAHSDLALAASGTVTIEAALLGTPMVTFYRVTPLTYPRRPCRSKGQALQPCGRARPRRPRHSGTFGRTSHSCFVICCFAPPR